MTMEATRTYPYHPTLLVTAGLGGTVATSTPDQIPLQSYVTNDARHRERLGGVDCDGVLELCYRNLTGYSYLRPFKRARLRDAVNAPHFADSEMRYFNNNHPEYMPMGLLRNELEASIRYERDETPLWKYQGNAIAAVGMESDDHVIFFPTGEILQQVRVYRHSSDRERRSVSNPIECGNVVRQIEMVGSQDVYDLYGSTSYRAVARGTMTCVILEADLAGPDPQLRSVHKLKFDDMLQHVAGSPHSESEIAFVTHDGNLHWWSPSNGVQSAVIRDNHNYLRCEYSSHPCVLWASSRLSVTTFDMRQSPSSTSTTLFDLGSVSAPMADIYGLKRRHRNPYQFVLGTGVSIEMMDSRMPGQSLISWNQRGHIDENLDLFGMFDEVQLNGGTSSDRGLILSSIQGQKSTSVYPFALQPDGSNTSLLLAPLRSVENEESASQYVASDSPLALQLRDGGEWTSLVGMRALSDGKRSQGAAVYQLNNMGDLFCQRVRPREAGEDHTTAVQLGLPVGITAQSSDSSLSKRLPLASDAILPEYDADTLATYQLISIRTLLHKCPQLPEASSNDSMLDELTSIDNADDIVKQLHRVCQPSATLFRLHRFHMKDNKRFIQSDTSRKVLELLVLFASMSRRKKVVLEEDEYVEALEQIIERDFFPELPTLRKQDEQLTGTASVLRPSTMGTIDTARQSSTTYHAERRHRGPGSMRSESSSWDQPTPTREASGYDQDDYDETHDDDSGVSDKAKTSVKDMTLNGFVATHTSEDNAAFTELQEKAVEEHKQRYHWAYDVDEQKGDPKLHLLTNGTWISKEQRLIVDQILAPTGPTDNRPNAPETWPHRARNALHFPPELETTKKICQATSVAPDGTLLLENGDNQSHIVSTKSGGTNRLGRPPRGKKTTVYANSRFSSQEEKTTSRIFESTTKDDHKLVQMTPMIAPGVDASPLMTWGDIEGTPVVLDARATPERAPSGPSFEVKDTSSREKLAHRLDIEARRRKSQMSVYFGRPIRWQSRISTTYGQRLQLFVSSDPASSHIPLHSCTLYVSVKMHDGLYKLVVIGGGPAGIGVCVRAARTGFLARLLHPQLHGTNEDVELSQRLSMKQKGIAIVHDGDTSTFGSGKLGKYVINSNTFARSLLSSALDEKPDLDPPESINNTFLERAKAHESTKRLEDIGNAPACLVDFGRFLQNVGFCLIQEMEKYPETSKCLLNTRATRFELLGSGIYRVEVTENERVETLYAEHLVLAMGGKQSLPASMEHQIAYKDKLFLSDECLDEEGIARLRIHLLQSDGRKVCIVGGSHSSFSVAWLLLNKGRRQSKVVKEITTVVDSISNAKDSSSRAATLPESEPPLAASPTKTDTATRKESTPSGLVFQSKDITILHRSPIRCYYGTRKEAEADGADGSRVDRTGCVNTFTGLRENSKNLYRDIKFGRETRVRLFQVNPNGCQNLTTKAFESANAIVWSCGYATRTIPGFDVEGRPLHYHENNGVVHLDLHARIQLQGANKNIVPAQKLFGVGLGFSLRSHVDEMGSETRADGVTVYHRRGATLVLAALFGNEVFGVGSTSFEEMVEKNDRKKKDSSKAESGLMDHLKKRDEDAKLRNESSSIESTSTTSCTSPMSKAARQRVVARTARISPGKESLKTRRVSSKALSLSDAAAPTTAVTNPPVKLLLQRRRSAETLQRRRMQESHNNTSPTKPCASMSKAAILQKAIAS
ncbi:hypothetical protein Poli38472_006239 [Pythium oligandrum]|uniref:Uncharacterized protein n=1 Tax=Pythium oligandrum TaxID=41045 RepID=A0A8K1CUA7_PYTOL|nr:hypothetical protein Poli38472_006239 [Pythium oligandrum]|eukprot:TMW68771.1 hypothetical protein Poli38472_006239 [Pythium oligandrum]